MLDFTEIDTQEKSYILGFIFADGNICCDNAAHRYKVNFTISEKDVEHIFKLREIIGSHHKVGKYHYVCNKDPYYTLEVAGKELVRQLTSHGLFPNKSLTLKPPTTVPKRLLSHFIRGYFDGDGSICINRLGTPSIAIVGTKEMMTFINQQFYSFYPHSVNVLPHKTIYSVNYKSSTALKFMHYIYQDAIVYLNRKMSKYNLVKDWLPNYQTKRGKNWSEAEIALLKNMYATSGNEELCLYFPNRSLGSVVAKAEKLKLKIKSWEDIK